MCYPCPARASWELPPVTRADRAISDTPAYMQQPRSYIGAPIVREPLINNTSGRLFWVDWSTFFLEPLTCSLRLPNTANNGSNKW
jgi:hypothetical protein